MGTKITKLRPLQLNSRLASDRIVGRFKRWNWSSPGTSAMQPKMETSASSKMVWLPAAKPSISDYVCTYIYMYTDIHAMQCNAMHCIALHYTILHYMTWHDMTRQDRTWHDMTLHTYIHIYWSIHSNEKPCEASVRHLRLYYRVLSQSRNS